MEEELQEEFVKLMTNVINNPFDDSSKNIRRNALNCISRGALTEENMPESIKDIVDIDNKLFNNREYIDILSHIILDNSVFEKLMD
jgi:hypothetical protein